MLSANVELSDTFDQWRMKNNGWISMTNSAGSSNFIKLTNTTNSTSNTTGSITTLGGIGIAKSAVVGGNLTVFGDADVDGTLNLDVGDIDSTLQIDGTLTVGVDDTGHDTKFFGATSGQHLLWDESEDELALVGDSKLSFHDAGGGENIVASADGHLEINAGTTLDITAPTVDINGVVQLTGATTVTGNLTVADGSNDFDIASHDGTNGLKLGGTLVTATAATINGTTGKSIAMAIVFG